MKNTRRASKVCRVNRSCVDHVHTCGEPIQGRKDVGANNVQFVHRGTEGLRYSMEKLMSGIVVENGDQRTGCGKR